MVDHPFFLAARHCRVRRFSALALAYVDAIASRRQDGHPAE